MNSLSDIIGYIFLAIIFFSYLLINNLAIMIKKIINKEGYRINLFLSVLGLSAILIIILTLCANG